MKNSDYDLVEFFKELEIDFEAIKTTNVYLYQPDPIFRTEALYKGQFREKYEGRLREGFGITMSTDGGCYVGQFG